MTQQNPSPQPLDSPPTFIAAQLADLLQKQLQLYEQLRGLSDRQRELVRADSVDELLALLSQRQKIIEALTRIGQRIDPHRAAMGAAWPTLDLDTQQRIGDLLDRIQTLVKSILDHDGQDRTVLDEARGRLGQQVQQTIRAGQAVSAYHRRSIDPVAAAEPRFADHKG